jgi:hypothetical protein
VRWFWWRINAWSELAAMIASLVIATLLNLSNAHGWLGHTFTSPEIFVLNVFGSAVVWITVAWTTSPDSKEHLDAFVKQVRPVGWWGDSAVESTDGSLRSRLGLWLVSIVALYGALFGVGNLLLGAVRTGLPLTAMGLALTIFVARRLGRREVAA